MANLTDSIKLNTEVDLNGLINLIQEFKDLGIKVKDVAAASRALTEQIKRDNLQQVNSVKLSVLEHDKLTATLINEDKVEEQVSKSSTARSKKKKAEIDEERTSRKNSQEQLLELDVIQQGINATEISNSNKKAAAENAEAAAINKKRTAIRGLNEELLADSVVQRGLNATDISESNKKAAAERALNAEKQKNISITKEGTAVINQGTAAINQGTAAINQGTASTKQETAAKQLEKEATKVSTEQQRLYNLELKNKALESKNAQKSSDGLSASLSSLTGLRSQLLGLFGAFSVGSFAQQMVEAQSKVESFGLSMKNLLGEKFGGKLVSDLKQFTVETPLNFEEVIKSSSQLVGSFKAAGASSREISEQVTPILDSLGNSAAALGGDDRLGRLIYAFSQVQATGRLMGTEVRQITETGFPLLAVMSTQTGKSVQELQKDISDGKVSFDMFQKAILSAGKEGGVFAGSMEIMANTVQGRIDKLKESLFFALSNIGNEFNGTAKSVIDFGSNLLKSLFGTESATKRTIDVVSNAVIAWTTYELIIRKNSAASVIWNGIQKIGLIIKGEAILATEAYIGMTIAETEAQIAATTAARSFNATLAANPFGFALLAITALVTAYQLYSSQVDEAKEFTLENVKASDSEVKGLISKQAQLNVTAKSVLGLTEGTEGYKLQIGQLIKKYPEYFGHLDAEKATHDQVRKALFFANNEMDRKIKLMAQEKLAAKVADKVADVKLQIAEEQIANQQRLDNEKAYQAKQIELKKKGFQDEYTEQLGAELLSQNSKKQSNDKLNKLIAQDNQYNLLLQKVSNDYAATQQEDYKKRKEAIEKKWQNKEFETKKQFNDAIIALDIEFGRRSTENTNKTAEEGSKAGKDIALKYKADTDKQKAILDQTNALRAEQKTRENQQKILDLEKEYDELRVNNAKGSQSIKVKELEKIETKYRENSANLTREWDKKDIELSEKFWNDIEKVEKQTQEDRVKFSKAIDKILEDAKEESEKNKTKIAEKYAKDLQKADEDNLKESTKLLDKKYNLMDKLRLLDKISHAKTSEEIIEIQKQENLKVLEDIKESIRQQLVLSKLRLERLRQEKGEGSLEYKNFFNNVLLLEEQYTDASSNLTEEQSNQLKNKLKNREGIIKESLIVIYEAGKNVLNDIFSIKSEKLSQQLQGAESELDKFRIRQQQKDLETEKKTISFFTSLASGNWVQAIGSLVSVIGDLSTNVTLERQAALLKDQLNYLKEIMGVIDSSLKSIGSSFDSISSVYGGIFDVSKLQQFTDMSNKSIEERIQAEIKHGEQITENYNKAVSKENDRYNKEIENIGKAFDLQVKQINDKYNLIELKAQQAYNSETLSITSAGSSQLEALIKNEESLSSVRAEFAQKRLDIENAFPLANKAITKDMSQSEIDAINASIDARDKSFAKLQGWYNQELVAIVNSEGQKRKEYTATEVIQNEINSKLELAAIKFQADEIQRAKDKADAILLQEKDKQDKIESQTLIHNNNLIKLESDKNIAIINSFSDLKLLLQVQIYQITGAMVDSANISTEAFQKLKIQLEEISNLYRALSNGTSPPTIVLPVIDIPRIPTGFEKGTDDTSVALKGQRVVDNKGGWQAILHPQEAVFSKADMTQMETVFGKRPTRQEVIENFKIGVVNQVTPQMNPFVIQKVQANGIGNFDKLSGEIRSLAKEVSKKMSPVVYVDKGGIRTFYKNLNSQIEVKNQRFK